MDIKHIAKQAKAASIRLAAVPSELKNKALAEIARALHANMDAIVAANRIDLENAQRENLAAPLLKRLKFDQDKITEAIEGIGSLIKLDDPVGKTLSAIELDQGLELFKEKRPQGGVVPVG